MPVEPHPHAMRNAAWWLHHLRAVVTGVLLVASGAVLAVDPQVVSIEQVKPGSVVATIRTADPKPSTTAFHLLFPGAAPDQQDIVATDITPVTNASADTATTVIVCVDHSGSMQRALPAIKSALQDAFAVQRPDLNASLLSFGSTISDRLQPLSAAPEAVSRAISGIRADVGADGKTLLYSAVLEAVKRLKDNPATKSSIVLVISDGKDEGSWVSLDSLINAAKVPGLHIDSIGYGKLAPQWSVSLKNMSAATGGTYVLAHSDPELSELIKADLGTAPLPAFKVQFDYPASSATVAPGAAILRYAVQGASAASVPVNGPIAAPEAKHEGPASRVTPTPQETWLDKLKNWSDSSSPVLRITFGSLTAALLALLAALAWMLLIFRRRTVVKVETVSAPLPENIPRARAPTQIGASFPPPQRGKPSAWLIGRSGDWRGKRFPIEHAMIHVGSDEQSELPLTGDDFVSRRHGIIRYESGTLYLIDLASTNGTFLNGARVSQTPRTLSPGDELRFGRTAFELRGTDEGAPISHRSGDRNRVP
ncbi:FHA domain-containing protein [Paraburkholderia sp. GAS42]|uniref:FHA domain-containing protein n=1 Tax=Paraburkholderia sp. GAS42 TaxID=3035135 RepID=UPI003D1E1F75